MFTLFSDKNHHSITKANINFYASPFVHPKRKIKEHDFIYMLQGKWKIGQNNSEYLAEKDHILILSANNTHYGISPCDENTKTMYFHVTSNGDIYSDYKVDEFYLHALTDVSQNPNIKKYFSELVNCKLQNNQKKADAFFNLLICEMSDLTKESESDIAVKIKTFIHNSPEKFFSNKELAKKFNVSVKTAENHFKKAFSMSIHQYMLNFKIKEAENYFKNFPQITAKEVSYNLGFYDEYHFSKTFKLIKGVPPSEYKRNKI